MFARERVQAELRQRVSAGVPLREIVGWLRTTGASASDATELLEEIGLDRTDAEHVIRAHPAWKPHS
jgi:hypothetical protein